MTRSRERGYGEEDLIRVLGHDELRPGMTVVVTACWGQGCRHVFVLLRPEGNNFQKEGSTIPSGACRRPVWHATDMGHGGRGWCFCETIPKGRLFRLKPPEPEENPYVQEAMLFLDLSTTMTADEGPRGPSRRTRRR